MSGKFTLKKITALAFFTALSLVMFIVENQLPPLFVPGAKLGLANLFSLMALILFGPTEAMLVVLVRTLLGSLITGTVSALLYSLSGGAAAIAVAAALIRLPRVSVIAVSVASATVHNIVQNVIFALVSHAPETLSYLPYLALIGVASGALVGAVDYLLIKHLPSKVLFSVAGGGKQ